MRWRHSWDSWTSRLNQCQVCSGAFATKTVLGAFIMNPYDMHFTATNMEFLKWSYHDFPYLRFQTHCAQQSLLLFSPQDGQRSDSWTLHQFFMAGNYCKIRSKMLVLAYLLHTCLYLVYFCFWVGKWTNMTCKPMAKPLFVTSLWARDKGWPGKAIAQLL